MKSLVLFLALMMGLATVARAEMPALSKEFQDYMLAHHYVAVGLESGGANRQWIRAKINGHSVVLAVDTGCSRTTLTYQCARSLGLDIRDTGRVAGGLGGELKGHVGLALIQSFQLDFGEINRTNTVEVDPKDADFGEGIDGVLGLDFLALNAGIYPVGGHGLLLKPGPTAPVAIGDFMMKLGFKAIPVSCSNNLVIGGHINGAEMRFIVDSGAPVSDFRLKSVRAAGVEELGSTILPLAGVDGKFRTTFEFIPKTMDLGGFEVSRQHFLASDAVSFERSHFDGLIGVDLLGTHRAVVDLGGSTLWMR